MAIATCPHTKELERLIQGRLPESATAKLEQHVQECAICQANLKAMVKAHETMTGFMAHPNTVEDPASHPMVQKLIDKLESLHPHSTATAAYLPAAAKPEKEPPITRIGAYKIIKKLGAGGMGVVYEALDVNLERPVALKVLNAALARSEGARKRFLQEARSAAQLQHDNIVPIYQVGEDQGVPYLVMQLLEGYSLADLLARHGVLSPAHIVHLGLHMAKGLALAHARGLIHRDIKPGNIWVEPVDGARAKLLDFGLARQQDSSEHLTQTGLVVGTPAFMAPEQACGETVDGRSDLFSLGAVFYLMCTGKNPFHGKDAVGVMMDVATRIPPTPSACNPEVPAALSALVMQLLAKEPADRPGSAQDVVLALKKIQHDMPVDASHGAELFAGLSARTGKHAAAPAHITARRQAVQTMVAPQARRAPRRGRRLLVAGLACALFGMLIVAGSIWFWPAAVVDAPKPVSPPEQPAATRPIALQLDGRARISVKLQMDQVQPITMEAYVTVFETSQQNPVHIIGNYGQFALFMAPEHGPGWAMSAYAQAQPGMPQRYRQLFGTEPIQTNRCYHLAAVRAGKQLSLFVDGKLAASDVLEDAALDPGDGALIIDSFQGIIHEIRISSTARYKEDFAPAKRFTPDEHTQGLYHCDEGQGRLLLDSSDHGHHGVITGTTWVYADGKPLPSGKEGFQYLDELPVKDYQGWNFNQLGAKGLNMDDAPITCKGKACPRSLITHPEADKDGGKSRLVFDLDGRFETLTGRVGLPDKSATQTPLTYQILGDGRLLWISKPPVLAGNVNIQDFEADVRGVKDLSLEVLCPGSNFAAHAIWIDPLLKVSSTAAPVKPNPPELAKNEIINTIGMKLVAIPRGYFRMGSPDGEKGRLPNETQHDVDISQPFFMGKHEVTVGQFRQFVADQNYQTLAEVDNGGSGHFAEQQSILASARYHWKDVGYYQSEDHPVVNVSWYDAVAFCEWLSAKEGKHYRLPTEAEWEYACRAGSAARFQDGDAEESLQLAGNVADLSFKDKMKGANAGFKFQNWDDGFPLTAPVGKFKANAFGLHDMHGNAWEWCHDWYHPGYYRTGGAKRDPQGPSTGTTRVMRGGSFARPADGCRSASRKDMAPTACDVVFGFRVVQGSPLPAKGPLRAPRPAAKELAGFTAAVRRNPKAALPYFYRSGAFLGWQDYERAVSDQKITLELAPHLADQVLLGTVQEGGRAFDAGEKEACCNLYTRTLVVLRGTVGQRADLQAGIVTALNEAARESDFHKRGWILRRGVDAVRQGLQSAPSRVALAFAANQSVQTAPIPAPDATAYTYEVWVNSFDDTGDYVNILEGPQCNLGRDGKKFRFYCFHEHCMTADIVAKNTLTHLAGVTDGKRMRLYVNGKLMATVAHLAQPEPVKEKKITLGGENFRGQILGARISTTARYQKNFVPPERFLADKDTLAVYRYDEGQGTVLKDSSGKGHDGKIAGATWVKAINPGVAVNPTNAQALLTRGSAYAAQGAFADAAADYKKVCVLHPREHVIWYYTAPLLLEANDVAGYRRHCQEMLQAFGDTKDPPIAERTAKACLLLPVEKEDMKRIAALTELALRAGPNHDAAQYFEQVQALADYRAGDYKAAEVRLRKYLAVKHDHWNLTVPGHLIMAMALHQQQHPDQAKAELAKSIEIFDKEVPPLARAYNAMNDVLICRILRREAEALILPPPKK